MKARNYTMRDPLPRPRSYNPSLEDADGRGTPHRGPVRLSRSRRDLPRHAHQRIARPEADVRPRSANRRFVESEARRTPASRESDFLADTTARRHAAVLARLGLAREVGAVRAPSALVATVPEGLGRHRLLA